MKYLVAALLLNILSISASLSQPYPQNYFRNPLDIPISLAGSFGEMRPNHFHSGIDIKTEGVEGKNVYAVADGYVSRIRVQAYGFGNALYITHPNGYVSVYGHLKSYHPNIAQYLKASQYAQESFEVDIFPKSNELPVKKGDIVAYSGNTGSSGGPHLHFELRDAKTEITINPQLFGYEIKDHVPPVINAIKIYPLNTASFVEGKSYANLIQAKGHNGEYYLTSIPKVYGKIGFGITTFDSHTSAMEKNGVYSLELKVDNKRIYYSEVDKFSFSETRNINSHIDYEERQKYKRTIQKSCVDGNNKCSIYKELVDNGTFFFRDNQLHSIEYIAKDFAGNTSILKFKVQGDNHPDYANAICKKPECQDVFPFGKTNIFKTSDLILTFPPEALYDTLYLSYTKSPVSKGLFSDVHHIHNNYTPVNFFDLQIKPISLPEKLKNKTLLVRVSAAGGKIAQGGKYENGYVKGRLKEFGNYAVAVDTVPPSIIPVNIRDGKHMSAEKFIKFKISDNLSGVQTYRAEVDGKWILMELDGKSASLSYKFDDNVSQGSHELVLIVSDAKENKKEFRCNFVR